MWPYGFVVGPAIVGFVADRSRLPDYYRRAHVLACPAYHEVGVANVCVEAMACGCPVVACNTGGAPEAVLHGDSGFLVPPNKAILETALDMGIDLPYSCQSGLCTACRGKAISGKVKLDEEEGLSQSERAEGYVLTCVGHPLTDDVVIEIG